MAWYWIALIGYVASMPIIAFIGGVLDLDYFTGGTSIDDDSIADAAIISLWPVILIVILMHVLIVSLIRPVYFFGKMIRKKADYVKKYREVLFCRRKDIALYLTSSKDEERKIARRRLEKGK